MEQKRTISESILKKTLLLTAKIYSHMIQSFNEFVGCKELGVYYDTCLVCA